MVERMALFWLIYLQQYGLNFELLQIAFDNTRAFSRACQSKGAKIYKSFINN